MTTLEPSIAPAILLGEGTGLVLAVFLDGEAVFAAPVAPGTSWCALGGVVTFTALVAVTIHEVVTSEDP